jgi:hypothetical protein
MKSLSDVKRIKVEGRKRGWSSLRTPIIGGLMLISAAAIPVIASETKAAEAVSSQPAAVANPVSDKSVAGCISKFKGNPEIYDSILYMLNDMACEGKEIVALAAGCVSKYGDFPKTAENICKAFDDTARGYEGKNLRKEMVSLAELFSSKSVMGCIREFEDWRGCSISKRLIAVLNNTKSAEATKAVAECALRYREDVEPGCVMGNLIAGTVMEELDMLAEETKSKEMVIRVAEFMSSRSVVDCVIKNKEYIGLAQDSAILMIQMAAKTKDKGKLMLVIDDILRINPEDASEACSEMEGLYDKLSIKKGISAETWYYMKKAFSYKEFPDYWRECEIIVREIQKFEGRCMNDYHSDPPTGYISQSVMAGRLRSIYDNTNDIEVVKDTALFLTKFQEEPNLAIVLLKAIEKSAGDEESGITVAELLEFLSKESVFECMAKLRNSPLIAEGVIKDLLAICKESGKEEAMAAAECILTYVESPELASTTGALLRRSMYSIFGEYLGRERVFDLAIPLSMGSAKDCILRYKSVPSAAREIMEWLSCIGYNLKWYTSDYDPFKSLYDISNMKRVAKILSDDRVVGAFLKHLDQPETATRIADCLGRVAYDTRDKRKVLDAAARICAADPKDLDSTLQEIDPYNKTSETVSSVGIPGIEPMFVEPIPVDTKE